MLESSSDRRVDVTWDVKGDFKRPVALRIISNDRPGLLAKISKAFAEVDINITEANVKTAGDRAVVDLQVNIAGLKQLHGVLRDLQRIDGVLSAERV